MMLTVLTVLVLAIAGPADSAFAGRRSTRVRRSTTTTVPTSTAPTGTTSVLRPLGSPILSDADAAARVRRSSWEPRPTNAVQNATVPTAAELATFHSYNGTGQWGNCDYSHRAKVTGNFKGTTDEIIQWAAWKWGLPEDTLRAVATRESWWRMEAVGDNGQSFGITQVKNASFHAGTYPISKNSTAFNADYHAGIVRQYFEGCSPWLKNYVFNGTVYAAGDLWGSIGTWYSGRWHDDPANNYIAIIKDHQANRTWAKAGF